MPEFRQTKTGTLVRVLLGYRNGKPIRKSKTFPKGTHQKTMEQWVKEIEARHFELGEIQDTTPNKVPNNFVNSLKAVKIKIASKPFDEVIDEFLKYKEHDLAERTLKDYTNESKLYLRGKFGRINKIAKKDIQKVLDEYKHLSPRSQKKIKTLISMILNYAVEQDYIAKNPIDKTVRTAKQTRRKKIDVLTVPKFKEALQVCDNLGLLTLLYTGIRISELLALTSEQVFIGEKSYIVIEQALVSLKGPRRLKGPKSNAGYRTLPIPEKLAVLLESRIAEVGDKAFLFQYQYKAYQTRLDKLCEALGVPRLTLHGLRHSHCTYLLAQKMSPVAVSRRLGHSEVGFTLRTYSWLLPSMEDEILEVLG